MEFPKTIKGSTAWNFFEKDDVDCRNANIIRFMYDNWIEDSPTIDHIEPNLYLIYREAKIESLFPQDNDG